MFSSAKRHIPDAHINKIAIFCGPVAQLSFVIFLPLGLLLPPISPSLSPEDTAAHYHDNLRGMKAGVPLMLLTATFWPIFCAAVNRQLSRIPNVNPLFLWAQIGAGSLGGFSMLIPSVFFAATTYRLDRDPILTQTLSDIAWYCFSMLFPPFVGQDLAISGAILSDKRKTPLIPHWVAYVMSALSLTIYPAMGVHCVHEGAMAWDGAVGFWLGAAGFGMQVGVLVFHLMRVVGLPDEKFDEDNSPGRTSEEPV